MLGTARRGFLLDVYKRQVKDVSERRKLYITMLMVSALASFIMIVPQNLYHTISGSEFITYLGVGNCDIRLDIRPSGETYEDEMCIRDRSEAAGIFP